VLRLTDQAASMIAELIDDAELPDGAGLRIAQRDDHSALAMALSDAPGPEDVVVVDHDVTVFLGPVAAERVAAQVLDARSGETGSAFYLRD
jgi:Fe-S cluster assembly iron-binding protein IscA